MWLCVPEKMLFGVLVRPDLLDAKAREDRDPKVVVRDVPQEHRVHVRHAEQVAIEFLDRTARVVPRLEPLSHFDANAPDLSSS